MLPENFIALSENISNQPEGVLESRRAQPAQSTPPPVPETINGLESRRLLPALLLLFVGSGCAALIYEIVWLQLLQLVIGLTTVSLGVLLGAYMGGMRWQLISLPRLVSARRHPLRVYALLEAGIGVIGIAILFGMPWALKHTAVAERFRGNCRPLWLAGCSFGSSHLAHGGDAARHVALGRDHAARGFVARLFLRRQHRRRGFRLPPGRVLPVAHARHGFCDLHRRRHQCTVAVLALTWRPWLFSNRRRCGEELRLDGVSPYRVSPCRFPPCRTAGRGFGAVYVAIALSGLACLGAEVVWTRLLALTFGATVYTFSIILACSRRILDLAAAWDR